jgi:hypothetical protein
MFAGSKELECDHRIAGVKVRMAVGADKASTVPSATFIDQSRPGNHAERGVSHCGSLQEFYARCGWKSAQIRVDAYWRKQTLIRAKHRS